MGHSYEFADDDNWSCIEGLCSTLNKQDSDIWFATNIEIFDYVTAFRRLEYGAEGSLVYNLPHSAYRFGAAEKLIPSPRFQQVIWTDKQVRSSGIILERTEHKKGLYL